MRFFQDRVAKKVARNAALLRCEKKYLILGSDYIRKVKRSLRRGDRHSSKNILNQEIFIFTLAKHFPETNKK